MKGRRLLLLLPILLLAGGAAYFFLLHKRPPKPAPPEQTYEFALADLAVNLADTDRPHYLSASLTIVFKGVDPQPAVEAHDAELRDAVITTTTQHTYTDLLTPKGKETLKRDLAVAAEAVLTEDRLSVETVLFTSFLMD